MPHPTLLPPIRMTRQEFDVPRLIVEVPSPSTQRQDPTTKLDIYRMMPSLEEIWLVRTKPRHVEVWQRREDGWHVADAIGSGAIRSIVPTSSVPLDET